MAWHIEQKSFHTTASRTKWERLSGLRYACCVLFWSFASAAPILWQKREREKTNNNNGCSLSLHCTHSLPLIHSLECFVCVVCYVGRHTTGRIKYIWLQKLTLVLDFIWIAYSVHCECVRVLISTCVSLCVWVLVRSTAVPISHSFEYLIHKPTIPAQLLKTSKTFGMVFFLLFISFSANFMVCISDELIFYVDQKSKREKNALSEWNTKYDMYQSFCTIKMQDETKNPTENKTFKFGWKKVGFFPSEECSIVNNSHKKNHKMFGHLSRRKQWRRLGSFMCACETTEMAHLFRATEWNMWAIHKILCYLLEIGRYFEGRESEKQMGIAEKDSK